MCGAPSFVAVPPERQSQAECHTMLMHVDGFGCRLAALEVSGAPPSPAPCSSGLALLGMSAASRKSASPGLHEARTLLGASADMSRCRPSVKPYCVVPLKKQFPASRHGRAPASGRLRTGATPRVPWSLCRRAREECAGGPNEVGHIRTLRRVILMVAKTFDEDRIGGLDRLVESAAKEGGYDLRWRWIWRRLDEHRKGTAEIDSVQKEIRAAVKQALQAKQQGLSGKGAKSEEGRRES